MITPTLYRCVGTPSLTLYTKTIARNARLFSTQDKSNEGKSLFKVLKTVQKISSAGAGDLIYATAKTTSDIVSEGLQVNASDKPMDVLIKTADRFADNCAEPNKLIKTVEAAAKTKDILKETQPKDLLASIKKFW